MTDEEDQLAELEADLAADAATPSEARRRLEDLGRQALDKEAEVAAAEEQFKMRKAELEEIMRVHIPNAMTSVGVSEFGFPVDGGMARLLDDVALFGSLNRASDEDAAVDLLENSGFEGGVQSTLSLDFTQAEREVLDRISAEMARLSGRNPKVERSVNASTLKAFARQALAQDPSFDLAAIGLTPVRQAKFTKRR